MAIGDVGIITPEGAFDFFFNVYLAPDHPINDNYVPTPEFYPLEPPDDRDIMRGEFRPGSYLASTSVSRIQPVPVRSLQYVPCVTLCRH